ncbi:DUF87 domain-containing protein [Fusobacterium polymorphum]|uniref:Helicase HerA central domain-containing protein n=1 Tax=Fusobacterium nucleatum subsp. polymorphum TaxID=76857 RepID=A0A2C6C9K5_FUSNP|nr:DUF87 domain-containing protein [Fusobacterium polymorphum]PHI13071.1 hypothetical protein CBG59_04700 [Fusobacterium polymorphum]
MEYQVIEKEERLQFLEEMFESTELKVTESYSYPTIMEDLSNVVLYHIKEVTFEGEEKSPRREAFENVIGMIQNEGVNFIYLILGDKKGVSFYFGLVKESKYDGELPMPIDEMGNNLLKSAIRGNFRGSKIEEVSPEEMVEIFDRMQTNSNNRNRKYASVIGTPGINESEDKKSFQGVDRLVDVMQGDDFGLCILAKPLSKRAIKKIEDDLYQIYNSLSTFSKISLQEGENKSKGTSISKGTSDSVSYGENTTKGTNYSKTSGTSENTGTSESKTAGSTKGTNYSESQTEGKNWGKSEGKNEGTSKTKGWSEGSSSGSSSNSTNKGTNGSGTENWGTSYSENTGTSSSKGTNTGYSNSENMSKTKGTNTSTGTSESKTAGTSETTGTNSSKTTGTNNSASESSTTGSSQNVSKDIINKKAADYVKYIDEMLLPIIDYGKSKGLYLTTTFIFADNNSQLEKLGNTIKSLYSGKKGNKNPLEFEILENNDKKIEYFKNFQIPNCVSYDNENALTLKSHFIENDEVSLGNWYSPNELGLIAGLPEKEVVGLALNEEVEFGLNAKTPEKGEELISLGNLVQSGNEIDTKVYLEKSALNKHIFITGVTGTGKTTTCQKLLLESELPFLVIEPAKTEYRILMNNPKTEDILIFTLGNDKVAPFRLNPFEFFEGESITSRVDMLKAAMEASFDMEAAIPQIIESAMYSCYEDYGWNIDTDENEKFENPYDEGVYSFPTLEDLLNKVETEVTKHNFDDRLKKDYIGSITARLQGLLVGSKGQMLNSRRSIDFRELIEKKVVLEIEGIKNGTEKSLVMGFILTNLCEALRAKYNKDKHFKHITLIEEAHRLLSKYTPGDSLNKKNSVETFADMLAEVRKYGESLIIADQIPNKMTPEVLKNTNTKIVHKIFAEDDKEAIGNTISLSKEQKDFLSSLPTGRAIVFSQSWTKAVQVQIEKMTNTTSDENIDEDRLKSRVEDFYIENYKKGIFIGTKYEKITKEQFRLCRKFSTNKEFVKIFKAVFEENVNSFRDFERVMNLLNDKKFFDDIRRVLTNDDENIENLKNKFKEYYDIFSDDLHKTIYAKYYGGLKIQGSTDDNLKKIKRDLKESIITIFNNGDLNLEIDRSYLKKYIQK